jgi:allophanate hydrolase
MTPSIAALVAAYQSGSSRPADELTACIARIRGEGERPVWISTFDERQLLAQLDAADSSGPLYGVPFAVKDNIDVAGLPTTAACPEFSYMPVRHAPVVERLVQAGAIVVGKTNLDQFATGLVGTRTPYGACSSVFDSRYISGGSSSGSAVAVAKGQVAFSLGTDTAGSGRVPAAFNALVGLKPTRGVLSTRGVVPACRSLDCVSLFTRSVADAELLFEVCAGYDSEDAFSREREAVTSWGDARLRVGVPQAKDLEFFGDLESADLFLAAVERVKGWGAEIVRFDYAPFRETAALLYAGPWVAERLTTVAALLERSPDAIHPVVRAICENGRNFGAAEGFLAQYRLGELRLRARAVTAGCDVLLLPTVPSPLHHPRAAREPSRAQLAARHLHELRQLARPFCLGGAGWHQEIGATIRGHVHGARLSRSTSDGVGTSLRRRARRGATPGVGLSLARRRGGASFGSTAQS